MQLFALSIFVMTVLQSMTQSPDFPPVTTVNGSWVDCKPHQQNLGDKKPDDGTVREAKKYCFVPDPRPPPPEPVPVVNETIVDANKTVVDPPVTNKTVADPVVEPPVPKDPVVETPAPKNASVVENPPKSAAGDLVNDKPVQAESTVEKTVAALKKSISTLSNVTEIDKVIQETKDVKEQVEKMANATQKEQLQEQVDEIVKQAEELKNTTAQIEEQVEEITQKEQIRELDNRTHYHYQYQGHSHIHEFTQTNLGEDSDKEELISAPHFIFDVLDDALQFEQADILPSKKLQFDINPNATVIEVFHYHYHWSYLAHRHFMSVLKTEDTAWFVEFPWMVEKKEREIVLTPEQYEALKRGESATINLQQQTGGSVPINDPRQFKQFLETAVNETEEQVEPDTTPIDPSAPNATVEYLEFPVKGENNTYGTLRLPLEFNDTLEVPEVNSTHYAYIYSYHTHQFNLPQLNQKTAQTYTHNKEKKIRFSQQPLDSVEQDENEVVVHYHVHQVLHLHVHSIEAVYSGFLYKNESLKQEPSPKYPRVQPGTPPVGVSADPSVYYVPGTIQENHGNNSQTHYHYKYVEKDFQWGQEHLGEIEEDEVLQHNIKTNRIAASISVEDFSFLNLTQGKQIDSHVHYHYQFARNYHNHTIGIREKDLPQTVHTLSSNIGTSIVPTPDFLGNSWLAESLKYALILFVGYLLYKFLSKKFSRKRRRNVNSLDELIVYRALN